MNRVVAMTWLAACLSFAALAGPGEETTIVQVQLKGALYHRDKPGPGDPDLALELQRRFGVWGPVLGIARNYNMGTHWGFIDKIDLTETTLETTIAVDVTGDPWIKGGPADFVIKAQRDGSRLSGSFEGMFRGKAVKGEMTGLVLEPSASRDFVPLQRGEHPRVLFRKSDVPRLKRLLETPFGKAARTAMRRDPMYKTQSPVNDMDSVLWLGVEYQVTGDKAFADRAWEGTKAIMADGSRAPFVPEVSMAWQIDRVSLAYDLCHDAWSESARQQVRVWLLNWYHRLVKDAQAIYQKGNWQVGSNHTAQFYGAMGMLGLVLFDDPGPEPSDPTPHWLGPDVPAAHDLVVKPGTPVVPLTADASPAEWLLAAPFPSMLVGDPVASMQGIERLHPGPGDKAAIEDMTITFDPIGKEDKVADKAGGIALKGFLKTGSVSLAAYTVIECKEPGLYKVVNPFTLSGRSQIALNGKLVAHDQVVRLEAGKYPVMLMLRLAKKWNTVAPRFVKATEQDLAASAAKMAEIKASLERVEKAGDVAAAYYKASSGGDPETEKLFRWTRWHMWIFARDIVGDGGTGYESGIDYDIHRMPACYNAAYRRMFGYPLSPFPDISHVWPRRMMQAAYTGTGIREGKDMHGTARFDRTSLAGEFALLPDDWRPAALWVWHRLREVADPRNPVEVLENGRWAIEALLNYPYDIEKGGSTTAPGHPGDFLPRTWAATHRGLYIFRNGARSADDCIVQAYAKGREISGWNSGNAGAFRLYGLGHDWVHHGRAEHGTSLRMQESVVDLPDDKIFATACGAVLDHHAVDDGSGGLTIDLRDVYSASDGGLYQTYLGGRREGLFRESGISGWRAVGVDYSGISGATCLLALVDRIEGGKRKVWRWPLDEIAGNAAVDGRSFTVKQGGATLHATFVAPDDVAIRVGTESKTYIEPTFSRQRTDSVSGVFAEAPVGDAVFFVVITLQKGDPPGVESKGNGLDAVISVGKQTVRVVDRKVVFGK